MGNIYFGLIEQESVEEYLTESTSLIRKQFLYSNIIQPALKKIVSHYAYRIYNLENIEVLKEELYSHAMETLHTNYAQNKGQAFSYLSNVVKNKCIEYIRIYKKQTNPNFENYLKSNAMAQIPNYGEDSLEKSEYMESLLEFLATLKFNKPVYNQLTVAVIDLINQRNDIPLENKKKIILMLHEYTKIDIKNIAIYLSKLKSKYAEFKKGYLNNEYK